MLLDRLRIILGSIAVGLMLAALYLQVATFAPVGLDPRQTVKQAWYVLVIASVVLTFTSMGMAFWLYRASKRRSGD